MTYPIGTLIKKVRGLSDIGLTGRVVPYPEEYKHTTKLALEEIARLSTPESLLVGKMLDDLLKHHTMAVQADGPWHNNGIGEQDVSSKDTIMLADPTEWEPIIFDKHEPAEEDFELPGFCEVKALTEDDPRLHKENSAP